MKKPLGLKVLSPLHVLGGIVLLVRVVVGSINYQPLEARLGGPPILAIIFLAYLGILAVSSGIGLWLGRRWGWWLGAFFYTHAVVRYLHYLNDIPQMAQQFHVSVGSLYALAAFKSLAGITLAAYFFKRSVINYFQFRSLSKLRAAGILIGGSIFMGSF